MAYVLDIYTAHQSWQRTILSTPPAHLGQYENANPEVMNILARVRQVRAEVEKRGQ